MPNGFTPGQPSHATTMHDHLPLPGGKSVGDEPNLTTVLVGLDVPGVSHSNGREANAGWYAEHLNGIHNAAGKQAVNAWLEASK